jgi:hypothetical protein
MAVSLKMCGLETLNGTLGMEWGFGPELYRSQLNVRNTEFFLSSWIKHLKLTTRLHVKPTLRMTGRMPPLTSIWHSSEVRFLLECTIKFADSHYTPLFVSTLTCQVHSSVGVKQHCEVNFVFALVYTTVFLYITNIIAAVQLVRL